MGPLRRHARPQGLDLGSIPAGEIWVDLLTDTDGQYTEPQAGRLLNQSDHEFLDPATADRWREVWFPYRGIGPMVKSSPVGVFERRRPPTSAERRPLSRCGTIDDDLVVTSGGEEIYRERMKA